MSPAVEGLEYLVGFVAGERQSEIVLFLGPVLFMNLSWAALPRLGRSWAATESAKTVPLAGLGLEASRNQ